MREMVLNHASLSLGGSRETVCWLGGMARGMAVLVRAAVVKQVLRTERAATEIRSLRGWSLFDGYQSLRQAGLRDEYAFLLRLTSKTPLLADLAEDIKGRFLACEARECETRTLAAREGEPLVLCAVNHGVAVSFPSESVWDRDQLTVRFNELLPNGELGEAEENIDNLARPGHAEAILDRHRRALSRDCSSGVELWVHRRQLYPHLLFGPDVEAQIRRWTPACCPW